MTRHDAKLRGGISGGAPPESPDRAAAAAELRRAARDTTTPTADAVGGSGLELEPRAFEARQNLPPSQPVRSLTAWSEGDRVVLVSGGSVLASLDADAAHALVGALVESIGEVDPPFWTHF